MTDTDSDLFARVRAWIAGDPEPADRAALTALVEAGDVATLRDCFSGFLRFGTAGLRGPLRPGPAGMNTAVVRRAAAGLAAWLRTGGTCGTGGPRVGTTGSPGTPPLVVVGADGRHGSRRFALDSVRVLAGAGLRAALLPVPVPTPVLAFAVRLLSADAGIMVTASHNPATDNGYKVYRGAGAESDSEGAAGDRANGTQIVPPEDADIEAAIDAVGPAVSIPLGDDWTQLGEDVLSAYVAAAAATAPRQDREARKDLRVAYTPLHGVGADVVRAVFTRAGLAQPFTVPEQAHPDPDFPTVAFPNPEEPGAMERVLALGREVGTDVVIANDPDADRLAVAVGERILTGDEVGLLLADEVLRTRPGPVATTVVSSSALAGLAAAHGVPFTATLTGFKWLMRARADLVFAYEEALGYAVAPHLVRDKDGITAALAVAGIAAAEKRRGRTLLDRLDDLVRHLGLYTTAQVSVRVSDVGRIGAVMAALRSAPPASIGGTKVLEIQDLAAGGDRLPPADLIVFRLADGARVVVRPSGTEPKIKAYLEVIVPVAPEADATELAAARSRADAHLAVLRPAVRTLLDA